LELLAGKGEMSATEICEHFAMSHPAVSQHLKILRETELVQLEKIAQRRIYRLNPYALNRLGEWLKQMTELWDQRFERLDQVLEKEKRKTRKKAK
jgi:DNA-binding transcriptional ArsR family regulator